MSKNNQELEENQYANFPKHNQISDPIYADQKEVLDTMNLSVVSVDEDKKLVTFSNGTTAPLVTESEVLAETKNLNVGQKVAKIFSTEKIVKTK